MANCFASMAGIAPYMTSTSSVLAFAPAKAIASTRETKTMTFALTMTDTYQAAGPSHFTQLCEANALKMSQEADKASPGIWQDYCIRQAAFWKRAARNLGV